MANNKTTVVFCFEGLAIKKFFICVVDLEKLTISSGGKMASCVGSYGVKSSALNNELEFCMM